MVYDSRPETWRHIHLVQAYLLQIVADLAMRAHAHDQSKLEEPELSIFNEFTPRLKGSTYGSDEYKSFLTEMGAGLNHHYEFNDHHPEHFACGVKDMNLIQIMEMLADWKAATERHDDGDLRRSIEINAVRYDIGDDLKLVLVNTAHDLGWL